MRSRGRLRPCQPIFKWLPAFLSFPCRYLGPASPVEATGVENGDSFALAKDMDRGNLEWEMGSGVADPFWGIDGSCPANLELLETRPRIG
jgi:hypothetical protein